MTIDNWIDQSANTLADAMIPSARLDTEVILAHTLGKPRTWLHAHGDDDLDPRKRDIADARVQLRLERVPVAYIVGHKEFYGRRFNVSTATLIPRPESETIITELGKWLQSHPEARDAIDVGTGSGALGITAALEYPSLRMTLADISDTALRVAEKNATMHNVQCKLLESNLLDAYPLRPDIIIANLPYVDPAWEVSAETRHEPLIALFASDGGLALIKQLLDQAESQLSPGGLIILEADPRQHQAIATYASQIGLSLVATEGFVASFTNTVS